MCIGPKIRCRILGDQEKRKRVLDSAFRACILGHEMSAPNKPPNILLPSEKGPGRRPGQRNVSNAEIATFQRMKLSGLTNREIAERTGRSRGTIEHYLYRQLPKQFRERREAGEFDPPPPRAWDELAKDPRERLEDFRAFRNHYFERDTPNFQREVADLITQQDPEDTYIYLMPPGSGKSTAITHDFVIWNMLRRRAWGQRYVCLLLSKSDRMGGAFVTRIKRTLESNRQLSLDYGWFKAEFPDTWTKYALTVDGFDLEAQGKEPTFIGAGVGSHIYGWRVDQVIADDLIDKDNAHNLQRNEEMAELVHEIVETRMEDYGTFSLVGTRFAGWDLYGLLLSKVDDDGQPLYKSVIYPVHDEEKCPGPDGPHLEYPDGCHIWPEKRRWSYRNLRRTQIRMGTDRFNFLYNQAESGSEEGLVEKRWLDLAYDRSRILWDGQSRPNVPQGARLIASLDPSPKNWAVAQIWAFRPIPELEEENEDGNTWEDYLIACHRARMQAPEYIKLMEDWTVAMSHWGHHMIWVVEVNAAQTFLLDSNDFKRMRMRTNIRAFPHTTTVRKLDPNYGVQSLKPRYEYGRISLPWGDADTRNDLAFFTQELCTWPEGHTDDGVMAQWFAHANRNLLNQTQTQGHADLHIGDHFKRKQKLVVV